MKISSVESIIVDGDDAECFQQQHDFWSSLPAVCEWYEQSLNSLKITEILEEEKDKILYFISYYDCDLLYCVLYYIST